MNISRKNALKSIFGALITLPVFGKKQAEKDFLEFKKEFSEAWKSSLDYTLKLYNQMPEEKFDFRYTPESFSFRTQFVHCLTFNTAQICGRLNILNPHDEKEKKTGFWKNLTKAELETEIKDFYAWVEKTLFETKPEKLMQLESFAGGKIPVWRLFYALENHIIHHRGQVVCYLRLCGITPIGYIGW